MSIATIQHDGKRPLAPTSSAFSSYFWERLAVGELLTTCCTTCGDLRFPPRQVCSACGANEPRWAPLATEGVVYTRTRIHATLPQFSTPVDAAIVDLDDGVRLVSALLDYDSCPLDARVELVAVNYEDGALLAARAAR